MEHKSFTELEKDLEKAKKQVCIGGIYSHYKHPENHYKILDLAIQEATNTICVIYEPLYNPGFLFVRDVEKWIELIEVKRKKLARFSLIS